MLQQKKKKRKRKEKESENNMNKMSNANELNVFESEEFGKVRTTVVNGEAYFVGKDVAEILGYTNTAKAIRDHVDEEDKLTERIVLSGQNREVIFINESGLYSLILSSKMPKAKAFKRWVTSDVLPTIRKYGLYAVDDLLEDPDLAISLFTQLKEERKRKRQLELQNSIQRQQIAEMKPKVGYYDIILQSSSVIPITQIAKDYGMSGRKMNQLLHDFGVQYKMGNTWLLYQEYAENGYTQSKTHIYDNDKTAIQTYWTQKGRLFLYDLLKGKGIYPMIERSDVA